MWRVALACLGAAGCNQVFGLDPASGSPGGDGPTSGSDVLETCVQTGCSGQTPICDDQSHICRACLTHADCATSSDVCIPLDFPDTSLAGSCADAGSVAYLDPSGGGATCSQAAPCAKVAEALATGRPFVKFTGQITDNAAVSTAVTFFADPGASLTKTADGALLTVSGVTADLRIYELTITGATSNTSSGIKGVGVNVVSGQLEIEHVRVIGNDDVGIVFGGSSLTIARSTIDNNAGGGVDLTNGSTTFSISNTFITRNGGNTSTTGGVHLFGNAAGSRFEFNTLYGNNTDVPTQSGGITCDVTGLSLPNNLSVHNQIQGDIGSGGSGATENVVGPTCTQPTTLITSIKTFSAFGFAASDDFHLTPGASDAIDRASFVDSVKVDVDDQTRPLGSLPDIGADELMP